MMTRKIKSKGLLYREFNLNREAVNEEARTVELSMSSETQEVERWFGVEILDHSPGSVRLGRLQNGGPLLFLHDMRQHIGVIEDAKVEKRRGKAIVRFGNSALAEEKFRDVLDGILTKVSIGYRVFKLALEERNDDAPDVHRAVDWEPYEISLLPVAADDSVGVGRSAGDDFEIEIEDKTMEPEMSGVPGDENRGTGAGTQPAAPTPAPAAAPEKHVDVRAITNEVRDTELKRIADLDEMGERYKNYGGQDLAREYVKAGKSVEQLRSAILERLPTQDNAGSGDMPDTRLDLSAREMENYSLMRAITAVMEAKNGNMKAMRKAEFEMECSRELGERLDRDARGFFVPIDIMSKRVMDATNNADLIATNHMGDMYINSLRPKSIVLGLGATVMDGLDGNLDIPRELGTPSFGWIGDDDDAPMSEGSHGSLKMAPKTLAGAVPMSRRLLKQSSPSVERLVHNALLKGAALGVDYGILMGTGTNNQPMGITNLNGVNIQTVATPGTPSWSELVGFESKVAADEALEGHLAYATTSNVRGNLKTTPKDAGSGLFLMDGKEANGHSVAVSNQLQANRIIFGNWEDVYVGFWGVIDVNPDVATKAGSGGMILRVFQDADVGVGHAESFCLNG